MEKKSIPLNNSLREVDRAVAMGHMKGPWNHIYTSRNSAAGAAYASADSGYTNLSGFSWPPRLYVCSFCKREFRSAQALGGHMNVHRRDRARLRQSPPSSPPMDLVAAGNCSLPVSDSINLNLIPNPNPNLTPHSSTWMVQKPNKQTATYLTSSSLKSSCPFIISSSSGSSAPTKTPNLNYTDQHHNNFEKVNLNKGWEKGGVLRLGFGTSGLGKEDLDLELRLGYPS